MEPLELKLKTCTKPELFLVVSQIQ